MDDNVGKILDALKKSGLDQKTLVVFTNDNGGALHTGANNFPLKEGKGTLWEGGVRVPWAMRWPGKIEAGSVVEDPVIALDLMPTFITAAGGRVDPAWNLDGIDLSGRLTGKQSRLPNRTLYWRKAGSKGPIAIREGNWKLIDLRGRGDGRPELYDVGKDVGESRNLASENPTLVKSLSSKMSAWEKQLKEPLWGPGKRK